MKNGLLHVLLEAYASERIQITVAVLVGQGDPTAWTGGCFYMYVEVAAFSSGRGSTFGSSCRHTFFHSTI